VAPNQLLVFVESRPFIPFVAQLVGGREIVVRHPEYAVPAFAGGGFWLLHDTGHVEAIAGELIISMRTIDPVDAHTLTG
jgi:hypothetical protein